MAEAAPTGRAGAVAGYKALLRAVIERRPSGLRGRLALALGKHKSFVSQITSPAYAVPIPAADLPVIFAVCHLTDPERERFLALYREAHPEREHRLPAEAPDARELRIALPAFRSEATAREVEAAILDLASRIIRLAQQAEAADRGGRRS